MGFEMNGSALSDAVVEATSHTAVPHVDSAKLIATHGDVEGPNLAAAVLQLVQEANAMPIEWGDMTLVQGVNDIMSRYRQIHPELSDDALREIGRCVGWNWR